MQPLNTVKDGKAYVHTPWVACRGGEQAGIHFGCPFCLDCGHEHTKVQVAPQCNFGCDQKGHSTWVQMAHLSIQATSCHLRYRIFLIFLQFTVPVYKNYISIMKFLIATPVFEILIYMSSYVGCFKGCITLYYGVCVMIIFRSLAVSNEFVTFLAQNYTCCAVMLRN